MSQKRRFIYWDPDLEDQVQASDGDVIANVHGMDVVCGEAIAQYDVLIFDKTEKKAFKAKADTDSLRNVTLLALEAGAVGETIQCALPGNRIPGITVTPGDRYWLSKDTAGAIVDAAPKHKWVVVIGNAVQEMLDTDPPESAPALVFNPRVVMKLI